MYGAKIFDKLSAYPTLKSKCKTNEGDRQTEVKMIVTNEKEEHDPVMHPKTLTTACVSTNITSNNNATYGPRTLLLILALLSPTSIGTVSGSFVSTIRTTTTSATTTATTTTTTTMANTNSLSHPWRSTKKPSPFLLRVTDEDSTSTSSYETSDSSSKSLVSSLTDFVNWFSGTTASSSISSSPPAAAEASTPAPTAAPSSPKELQTQIQNDYTQQNYLWTGNLHLPSFEPSCTFTDPTLSFVGTDTFVQNVGNLRPIVEKLGGTDCRSDLWSIQLDEAEGYVSTRWNMVGTLGGLFWKPRVDVVGRTKFWYRRDGDDGGWRVYRYDEEWEMPAARALLQLVTPGGTISNDSSRYESSSSSSSELQSD